MELVLILAIFLSFLLTLFLTPIWIYKAKRVGLAGNDMHKIDKVKVAEAGGVAVLVGFVLGVLIYIALKTFYFNSDENIVEIFALLCSVLIIAFVGMIDDILGWKIGLNRKTRLVFLVFASIPLIVINAGESTMMGVEFGVLYPLFFIPLGIVATSSTFNFLAGYNGLEASQGIIVLSSLAIVLSLTGSNWLAFILLIMVVCLFAFYLFNKYPSKVFPGDILTYSVGALIGIAAILGNIEKIAIFFFIPYILEVVLKLRGNLKMESFGKLTDKENLDLPYEKIYGLEHAAILLLKMVKGKAREVEVVRILNLFQILIVLVGFVLFRNSIFG